MQAIKTLKKEIKHWIAYKKAIDHDASWLHANGWQVYWNGLLYKRFTKPNGKQFAEAKRLALKYQIYTVRQVVEGESVILIISPQYKVFNRRTGVIIVGVIAAILALLTVIL